MQTLNWLAEASVKMRVIFSAIVFDLDSPNYFCFLKRLGEGVLRNWDLELIMPILGWLKSIEVVFFNLIGIN